MKIAKAVALTFALVLVVVCFHSSLVYADHPWDEDGTIGGGGGKPDDQGLDQDTIIIVIEPEDSSDEGTDGGFNNPLTPDWIMGLQFLIIYHDLLGWPNQAQGE